jgi:putative N6-adenine-specific DNA methylase
LECELRKYQLFDGKMKQFRSEGGTVKTEEEKRQMAQTHRFKKEREFKQRLTEQEENEDADIRSFTFHRHSFEKEERGERKEERGRWKEERGERKPRFSKDSGKSGYSGKSGFKGKAGKPGKYTDGQNRGGHERFDRSGGNRNKKFNRDED